jgi:hypothetical protein
MYTKIAHTISSCAKYGMVMRLPRREKWRERVEGGGGGWGEYYYIMRKSSSRGHCLTINTGGGERHQEN